MTAVPGRIGERDCCPKGSMSRRRMPQAFREAELEGRRGFGRAAGAREGERGAEALI